MKNTPTKPKDLGRARRELDNDSVRRAYEVLQNWGNPFDDSRSSLINICSGIEASPEIKSDLLTAEAVGESCFESFWTDRIQSSNVPFYDPIKKLKLNSFTKSQGKKDHQFEVKNADNRRRKKHVCEIANRCKKQRIAFT